jgi:hypothetical protein
MRKRFATITVLCAGAALLAAPFAGAPALAAGLSPPVADCAKHLRLTHHYSPQELQNALNTMPAYLSEYSDCANVIKHQLDQELGRLHGGPVDGGGSFLPTWLLVVLILLVLGGVAFTTAAIRRRGGPGGPPPAT